MLNNLFCYSQDIQIKVIAGDTLVLVPVERIVKANIRFAKCDSVYADNYFYSQMLVNRDSIIDTQKRIIRLNELEIYNWTEIVQKQKEVTSIDLIKINLLNKEVDIQIKRQRMTLIGSGVLIILSIFLL
jgi:hypothetical protein